MRKIVWIILGIFLFIMFVAACGSSTAPAEQEKWAYIIFGQTSRIVKVEKMTHWSDSVVELTDTDGVWYRLHPMNVIFTNKPE